MLGRIDGRDLSCGALATDGALRNALRHAGDGFRQVHSMAPFSNRSTSRCYLEPDEYRVAEEGSIVMERGATDQAIRRCFEETNVIPAICPETENGRPPPAAPAKRTNATAPPPSCSYAHGRVESPGGILQRIVKGMTTDCRYAEAIVEAGLVVLVSSPESLVLAAHAPANKFVQTWNARLHPPESAPGVQSLHRG